MPHLADPLSRRTAHLCKCQTGAGLYCRTRPRRVYAFLHPPLFRSASESGRNGRNAHSSFLCLDAGSHPPDSSNPRKGAAGAVRCAGRTSTPFREHYHGGASRSFRPILQQMRCFTNHSCVPAKRPPIYDRRPFPL